MRGRNPPDDASLSVSTATVSVLQRGRHALTVYSYNVSEATLELSDPEHITDVHEGGPLTQKGKVKYWHFFQQYYSTVF